MNKILLSFITLTFVIILSCGAGSKPEKKSTHNNPVSILSQRDQLMDSLLCDGFDFPVGDKNAQGTYTDPDGKKHTGWYVATKTAEEYELGIHTGEDWNGKGGGNTDVGQPVYSTAAGKVIFAGECPSPWGNVILIEHRFAENGNIIIVYSQYAHLKEIKIKKDDIVHRRQQIGTIGRGNKNEYPAHLHFEIRKSNMLDFAVDYWPSSNEKDVEWVKAHYEDASKFIRAHRKIMVPAKKDKLVLIDKSEFKCYLFNKGNLVRTYEIALGQVPVGAKEKQGDLKVPEGEYKICERTKGPFSTATNWSAAYLGTRWMCLTYPNTFDAQKALIKKMITQEQFNKIEAATNAGIKPPQNTKLGGGIGLHGWIEEDWDNNSDRAQTWGCVSFHNNDLNEFYDLVDMKTTVIIIP